MLHWAPASSSARDVSQVSRFMNRFRKLGFIDYNDQDGLTVHSDLLGVLLNGQIAAIGNSKRRHSKKSQ